MYPLFVSSCTFNLACLADPPSYLYAVSMARNLDVQVENKHVEQFDVNERCGFSVKDIQSGFTKLQELCQPGKSPFLPLLLVSSCRIFHSYFCILLSLLLLFSAVYEMILLSFALLASPHDLVKLDQRWLHGLDSSGWLYFVRYCCL